LKNTFCISAANDAPVAVLGGMMSLALGSFVSSPLAICHDAFISYAHVDDIPFGVSHMGWVSCLELELTRRVSHKLGRKASIWRDPQIAGNAVLKPELVARLRRTAVLLPVVSPAWALSKWCRLELDEFVRSGSTERIIAVCKLPVGKRSMPGVVGAVKSHIFYDADGVGSPPFEFLPGLPAFERAAEALAGAVSATAQLFSFAAARTSTRSWQR
jgi:hypothetical protein